MNIFLPDLLKLVSCGRTMAALSSIFLQLRGDEVRDDKHWADYLTESLRLYWVSRTEIYRDQPINWPALGP